MRTKVLLVCGIAFGLLAPLVNAQQSASQQYRLSNALPASVAAKAQSPAYSTEITGGSGMPVGIAASDGGTVIAGPGSAPAGDFIFGDGLEPN